MTLGPRARTSANTTPDRRGLNVETRPDAPRSSTCSNETAGVSSLHDV